MTKKLIKNKKTVYIFAPANTMRDIPELAIEIGIKNLDSLGFRVQFGKNVYHQHLYTSGTIKERLEDIYLGLNDNSVSIMMAAYGGYNTNQLIGNIDYEQIKKSKKIFSGYSDLTILLNAILTKSSLKSIHGPSFASFCDPNLNDEVSQSFVDLINGKKNIEYITPKFAACDFWYLKKELGPRETYPHPSWHPIVQGSTEGVLIGGNLDSLVSLIGTSYLPSLNNRILLIETSIGEHPGKFDRQMMHLRHAGIFEKITGLIIGQFPQTSMLSQLHIIKEIIDQSVKPYQFPIMINGSFSHVDPLFSLPIGGMIKLDADTTQCKITIMDSLYE
ncbi:MAG: hypothetical protein ACD_60C00005G0004 [uncultured bacterium]|nr:MAG: hypothetical protein ACD_60C00005G0004 [uncultured bacterium]